jgi:DNA-binding beta-propeller fold protein YncE
VYVNHAQLSPTLITQVSSSLIRARIPDFILATPPTPAVLQIGVSEQSGPEQDCSGSDQTPCQITLVNARPGLVGPSPASISQGTAGAQSFDVDGGFFGTGANPASPAVTATYNGQLRGAQVDASQTAGSTRHMKVTIGGGSNSSDFSVPGLYPVVVQNARDTSKFAVANLAVQPNYNSGSSIQDVADLPVGTLPSDVAIDPSTGIAVVANTGSNDVTLINLTPASGPPTVLARICTYAPQLAVCPTATPSGPISVSIDYVRHLALVVNATSKSIAVVDLNPAGPAVTGIIPLQDTPEAVAINPVSGRALVAMRQKNYGVLVDMAGNPGSACVTGNPGVNQPAATGIVSISTGPNTKVAVEPHLNWAVATPGGLGSVGVVDLSQQSCNVITAVSRTTNSVTVSVQSTSSAPPLAVVVGDAVFIQNINFPPGTDPNVAALAPGFDGFYTVSAVGPGPNQFSYSQTGASLPDVATQPAPQAAAGSVSYSQPVATVAVALTAQGIAINPETQQAVMVDPTSSGVVNFFNLIDQSVTSLTLLVNNKNDAGTIAAAYNPLTNTVVAVNSLANTLSVIDPTGIPPTGPRRLTEVNTLSGPVAVAVDPGSNLAVVANQTANSISVMKLGPIQPFSITETNPKTFLSTSTLGTAPSPVPQTLTVIGIGFGSACSGSGTSLKVRLDGAPLSTSCSPAQGDRVLTATVPASMLTAAHRYAVDVFDPNTNAITNAADFTVEQSVDVTGCSASPEPSGVAIDPEQNLAAVSLFGCDSLALINLSTGTGSTMTLGKSAGPIGVAVVPRLHTAVVANNTGGTASIVDELQQSVKQTIPTGTGPIGAGADEAAGEVAITNSITNTVSVINVQTGGASTISTGQRPIAVAMNYVNHQVAVAASSSNLLGISNGGTGSASQGFGVSAPTSVVYDPVPTDCGSVTNGTTTNTTGCFIVVSSTGNAVEIIDPVNSAQVRIAVGINPTAVAYNYRTSTLVTTNTGSHTVTVADVVGQRVRAVLPLPPTLSTNSNLALTLAAAGSLQYALDVHPLTNIAVIADTVNGRVLFLPLPH